MPHDGPQCIKTAQRKMEAGAAVSHERSAPALERPPAFSPPGRPNALTRQLKELEEDGLILRTVIHDQPPKVVVYRLSVPELIPFLEALGSWCSEESEVCYGA